ncbi:MAG TPA: DUF4383 domain-containing protein [Burkholderiales bacterium]|jgi:hypothetical protein
MTPRSLALVLGLAYLGLGALGSMPGALAGLFRVNPGLALIHLAMGAWAIAAYAGLASASSYARSAAFVFAVLALVGMLHGLDRFLMPLDGANVWLHLATAAVAGFVGWRPGTGERRGLAGDRRRSGRRAALAAERRHGTHERRKASAAA